MSSSNKEENAKDLIAKYFPKWDKWDKEITVRIYHKYEGSWVRKWAIVMSFLGDPKLWGVALAVFGIYGVVIKDLSLFVLFFLGLVQTYSIYYVIKHIFVKRERPYMQEENVELLDKTGHGYSFPSGHVHHSAVLMGLIFLNYSLPGWVLPLLLFYNLLVGYSRIISGCHYVLDTFAAIILAYPSLLFYYYITGPFFLVLYKSVIVQIGIF